MDFLERLFGLWPDGGSGSTELMIIASVALIAVAATWRRISHKRLLISCDPFSAAPTPFESAGRLQDTRPEMSVTTIIAEAARGEITPNSYQKSAHSGGPSWDSRMLYC